MLENKQLTEKDKFLKFIEKDYDDPLLLQYLQEIGEQLIISYKDYKGNETFLKRMLDETEYML